MGKTAVSTRGYYPALFRNEYNQPLRPHLGAFGLFAQAVGAAALLAMVASPARADDISDLRAQIKAMNDAAKANAAILEKRIAKLEREKADREKADREKTARQPTQQGS